MTVRWKIIVGLALWATPLTAQSRWTLGMEIGTTGFSSAAHDTSTPPVVFRPWHPTSLTLRLARAGGSLGYGIGATLITGRMSTSIEDFLLLPGDEVSIAEIVPELRWQLARTSTGASAVLSGGPVWDLFVSSGYDPVSAFGGQAGVTLSLPLSSSLQIDLRGDITATGSMYPDDAASDETKLNDILWRGRFGLGIALGL